MIGEFATIVGLLSAFSTGRQLDGVLSAEEFKQWLTDHNHADILKIIEQNSATLTGIKAFLNGSQKDIQDKLDSISNSIATITSYYDGFNQLASAYAANTLSEQALALLTIMDVHKSEYCMEYGAIGAKGAYHLSSGPSFQSKEPQFIKDDLATMVNLGLLIQDYNSQGKVKYIFTRAASILVKNMTKEYQENP